VSVGVACTDNSIVFAKSTVSLSPSRRWKGSGDKKLIVASIGGPLAIVVTAWVLLLGVMHVGADNSALVAAALGFTGVVVTACVSVVGVLINRQAEKRLAQERVDEQNRLRLDAAMRAGQLLSGTAGESADPSVIASGLLALTKLDEAGLAVTLLVDLWKEQDSRVSTEAAILVIDAALECGQPAAQLIAAELLCRNAERLTPTQSLHWPSAIEGSWNVQFSAKTKLLIVEALMKMTLAGPTTESALRAVAVRLYGIWASEHAGSPDGMRVRNCIGKLIDALLSSLERFDYRDFIQANREVKLREFQYAAKTAATNPDGFLDQLTDGYARRLGTWAQTCPLHSSDRPELPSLASAECGSPSAPRGGISGDPAMVGQAGADAGTHGSVEYDHKR
jgi:hypothetical protein